MSKVPSAVIYRLKETTCGGFMINCGSKIGGPFDFTTKRNGVFRGELTSKPKKMGSDGMEFTGVFETSPPGFDYTEAQIQYKGGVVEIRGVE